MSIGLSQVWITKHASSGQVILVLICEPKARGGTGQNKKRGSGATKIQRDSTPLPQEAMCGRRMQEKDTRNDLLQWQIKSDAEHLSYFTPNLLL